MRNSTATADSRPGPGVFLLSLLGLGAVWQLASMVAPDPTILPGPAEVWRITLAEARSGELGRHMLATLARVAAALGLAIGVALGRSPALDRWFGPWVAVFLNVPALVVIVLCYLWIGLNEVAAITAVALNKTAMVAVTIREGVRAMDPKIAEMAQSYRMSRWGRFRHVTLPQLWPFIAASTRNGLAIIWKIVLVVEFLGRSSGVGFQIHLYFQLFDTGHVLAYSLSFVGVMLAIEYGLLQSLEHRVTRWRRLSA